MKFKSILAGSAAVLVTATILTQPSVAQNTAITVGSAAPDFSGKNAVGKDVQLSKLKGKWVVLEWNNYECPFVVKHYKNRDMQKLQKYAVDNGVNWITICSSAPGKQGFVDEESAKRIFKELNYQSSSYVLDPEGKIGRLYGARTTPHMFVINPSGEVVYMGGIDNIRSANSADIAKARNFVREALDAGLKGKEIEVKSSQPYGCSVKY